MRIIEIAPLYNGAHRNQEINGKIEVQEEWAVIPDDMIIPATFPFVNIEVDEIEHTRESTIPAGESETYTVMEVTKMTAGTVPEPKPYESEPTTEEILLELAADHEARLCTLELGV